MGKRTDGESERQSAGGTVAAKYHAVIFIGVLSLSFHCLMYSSCHRVLYLHPHHHAEMTTVSLLREVGQRCLMRTAS